MSFEKQKEFEKDLMVLLKKYNAKLSAQDKPVWPEQDREFGIFVEFYKTGFEELIGISIDCDEIEHW